MIPDRLQGSFTQLIDTLGELEALSSTEALPGASACAARLELRLRRYLAASRRLTSEPPQVTPQVLHALVLRVKDAVTLGAAAAVISAVCDLRDQLVAHHRALEGTSSRATP